MAKGRKSNIFIIAIAVLAGSVALARCTHDRDATLAPTDMPQGPLHYQAEINPTTIPCLVGNALNERLDQIENQQSYRPVSEAKLEHGDTLRIFSDAAGAFIVYVIGPDATGAEEGCEVARGTGFRTTEQQKNAVAPAP